MKSKISSHIPALAFFVGALPLGAQIQGEDGRPAMSRSQLIERLQQQKSVPVATAEEQQERWDLMKHAVFINFNGDSTLIPRQSIILLPERLSQHVSGSAEGKTVSWLEFSGKYPALVTRFDVTLQHASGEIPIDPAALESASRSGCISVAVMHGSPISVPKP